MKHFILRNQEIQIFNESTYFKVDRDIFVQLEPTFNLPINIKQLEYYPNLLHQTIHYNGTVETLSTTSTTYDGYISKLNVYIELKAELDEQAAQDLLPQTLQAAKDKVEKDIYNFASILQKQAVSNYSDVERDRWTTTILPEVQAYSVNQEPTDAPNLTAQHVIRTGITNTNSSEFKAGLLIVVNQVLQSNDYLVNYSNFIAGTRGKWLDVIRAFEQTNMETEKQAIQRLLALDWKQGWDMPAN
jgi:hypothetical protein